MPRPKGIRCEKCQVEMGVRHYVLVHRQATAGTCPPVPCEVCRSPVPRYGFTAFGDAVCSTTCFSQHPGNRSHWEAVRNVEDQLRAMRRAQKLPPVYERRRAS
jgi:hypothetical protein